MEKKKMIFEFYLDEEGKVVPKVNEENLLELSEVKPKDALILKERLSDIMMIIDAVTSGTEEGITIDVLKISFAGQGFLSTVDRRTIRDMDDELKEMLYLSIKACSEEIRSIRDEKKSKPIKPTDVN